MPKRRVFILATQPLFAQGVESLLTGRSGIEVVGADVIGPDVFDHLSQADPDVIIIESGGEEQSHLVTRSLASASDAKIIGLTPDDNRISIYYQQMRESRRVDDLLEEVLEPLSWPTRRPSGLRMFILYEGRYGERILGHIQRFSPTSWFIESWRASSDLPPVVDAPLTFLPVDLPEVHLVLSVAQTSSVAQLVPGVIERTNARSAIVPVDNAAWLPGGLARQLQSQLSDVGVTAVFPKPFCSLTEDSYNTLDHRVPYQDPWIAEFAHCFGQPIFCIDCKAGKIVDVDVKRDTACGSARAVARQLVGEDMEGAVQRAGLMHHHSPCSAAMRVDPNLGMPLIQVAGELMRQAVRTALDQCLSPETHRVTDGRTINAR